LAHQIGNFLTRTSIIIVGKSMAAAMRAVVSTLFLATCLPCAAQAQICAPNQSVDWILSTLLSDPHAATVRPADCALVEQNPPDFSWPYIGSGPYTVNLTFPDGHTESRTATNNWLNWNETLPAGNYAWTVTHAGQTSSPRQFIVSADAVPFVVPDMTSVINQLLAKLHPRGLPDTATMQAMASQRSGAIALLEGDVNRFIDSLGPLAGGEGATYGFKYGDLALKALTLHAYTGSAAYRDHAKARVLRLASWDPRGPTAIDNQESRFVAWVVTLGYDWLEPALSQAEKEQILPNLSTRIGDLYNAIIGADKWPPNDPNGSMGPPIWQSPRSSQGNVSAGMVAMMSTLLVGDLPAANTWVQELLPFTLNVVSPWSGEEGGYANGTPYSMWDVGNSLSAWYALRWATCGSPSTCIDLAQKAWVRNWGRYIAYFVPPTFAADAAVHDARSADPGTPIGLFGDGFAETSLFEQRARFAKGYTHFAPSALGCWYASGLVREDLTRIEYLVSPPNTCATTPPFPSGTANSLYLASIGWMAMHSDLADLNRTSVYFKSSPRPFGAYTHQSADQNAFVINAGGERLAIESGYYNEHGGAYDTGHWQYWVKRTKSKNAITFDGGQGQHAFEHAGPAQYTTIRYGSVTQQRSTTDYDIVTGDATDAYDGALTKAVRSLVYLRPGSILVYDNLASATPRTWEWNIHALDPITEIDVNGRVKIMRGTQSLCVDILAGPGRQFAQSSAWPSDAPTTGPQQSHGKFVSAQPSTAAEFIALMRVNVPCNDTAPTATKTNGVWTVPVDNWTVSIAADGGITVADTTPPTVSITSPASGATVSGMITVEATASDNLGVVGVQFKYNGISFGPEMTTAPYSVTGDTTAAPNGSYTLTAVARDAAGNLTTSAPVTVTVDNTAPTVSITSPASGATVSGMITVTASASDNVGIAGVQFKYNGISIGPERTTAPYSVTGDTTTIANGSYTLTAVARDTVGHLTTSAPVTVTVSNP
jgi:hypothetical protein